MSDASERGNGRARAVLAAARAAAAEACRPCETAGRPGPGRPVDGDKRRAILAAARRQFAGNGFNAGMGDIAAEAGVSKQTIYNVFRNKDELFLAAVGEVAEQITAPLSAPDPDASPEDILTEIAWHFMRVVISGKMVSVMHMLTGMGRGGLAPELAAAFYEIGPARNGRRLADWLATQHQAGRLDIDDPHLASEHFFGMLNGKLQLRQLLYAAPPPDDDEAARRVAAAVTRFMKAYAPEVPPAR
ncbi:TetR/AcrR family transcriptional regulator [Tistrella bauzanensis]|uniref:TetR/AcrR family transcriptional regulator n=1 Tax=Tistrella arctica TaxID=3133430 RepID=A0ABU9YJJ3_9PROT